VLANKQDLASAVDPEDVSARLGLHDLLGKGEDGLDFGRQWLVQGSCAHTGGGLIEGFSWLAETIRMQRKLRRTARRKSARVRSLSGP
jgi:Arf/Sar family protein